jgi:arsenite methyltransferase
LKKGGKLLVKLNPYITDEQIEEYGIKKIGDNLLDDGMILWNNTNEMWISIFQKKYSIIRYEEIIYEEYAQMNRMYLLERRSQ